MTTSQTTAYNALMASDSVQTAFDLRSSDTSSEFEFAENKDGWIQAHIASIDPSKDNSPQEILDTVSENMGNEVGGSLKTIVKTLAI